MHIFTEVMGHLTWLVDGQRKLGRRKAEFQEFLLYSTWLGRPISISSEAVLAWLPSTSLDSGFALLEKIQLCGKMFVGQRYLHSKHRNRNKPFSFCFFLSCLYVKHMSWHKYLLGFHVSLLPAFSASLLFVSVANTQEYRCLLSLSNFALPFTLIKETRLISLFYSELRRENSWSKAILTGFRESNLEFLKSHYCCFLNNLLILLLV